MQIFLLISKGILPLYDCSLTSTWQLTQVHLDWWKLVMSWRHLEPVVQLPSHKSGSRSINIAEQFTAYFSSRPDKAYENFIHQKRFAKKLSQKTVIMSGIINKIKDTLHVGQCSDPEHHHPASTTRDGRTEGKPHRRCLSQSKVSVPIGVVWHGIATCCLDMLPMHCPLGKVLRIFSAHCRTGNFTCICI